MPSTCPVRSVVATDTKVWIKKRDDEGTYWIAAETYAVQTTDRIIDQTLAAGAEVLRVGDGTEQ